MRLFLRLQHCKTIGYKEFALLSDSLYFNLHFSSSTVRPWLLQDVSNCKYLAVQVSPGTHTFLIYFLSQSLNLFSFPTYLYFYTYIKYQSNRVVVFFPFIHACTIWWCVVNQISASLNCSLLYSYDSFKSLISHTHVQKLHFNSAGLF